MNTEPSGSSGIVCCPDVGFMLPIRDAMSMVPGNVAVALDFQVIGRSADYSRL
jgi:hypothetical protein